MRRTLSLSEPRRYRDRAHLEFVASQACLICGRQPSDAHHLRFMQPRALGRRVSDPRSQGRFRGSFHPICSFFGILPK
jgi:hypothetical protein